MREKLLLMKYLTSICLYKPTLKTPKSTRSSVSSQKNKLEIFNYGKAAAPLNVKSLLQASMGK